MRQTGFFAGVDGGGTKTEACITDAYGAVLGKGSSGPANHFTAGGQQAMQDAVAAALTAALAEASLHDEQLSAICIGLAGVGRAEERRVAQEALRLLWPGTPLLVTEDSRTALAAAHGDQNGIVVIAGTGSNCLGRNGDTFIGLGGWGALLGDEGGAYAIALTALRQAIRLHEGLRGEKSPLLERFMTRLALSAPRDLIPCLAKMSTSEVAALAPLVFSSAKAGDALSSAIVSSHAETLVERAVKVAELLSLDAPHIALVGGCFRDEMYVGRVSASLQEALLLSKVFVSLVPPCEGAASLARAFYAKTQRGDVGYA